MYVLSNLVISVAKILSMILNFFYFLIIARAILSWVNPDPYNPIVQFLFRTTEPLLAPIRRRMPATSAIDFSPLILFVIILFLQSFLVATLMDFGYSIRQNRSRQIRTIPYETTQELFPSEPVVR